MAKVKVAKELIKNVEEADLVFTVKFSDNSQNLNLKEGIHISDLLNCPFRLAIHLKELIDKSIDEGQTREAVVETPQENN